MASEFNKYTTANAQPFKSRIEMVLLNQAQYVLLLDPAPTDGSVEVARRIMGGGGMPGAGDPTSRMAKIIAADPTLADEVASDVSGAGVSDAQLVTAVATHFLKLA